MKAVAAAVAEMSQEAIGELEKNGKYTLNLDGAEAVIEASDVEIFSEDIPGWLVANEGKLTVALEVTITASSVCVFFEIVIFILSVISKPLDLRIF